MKNLLTIFALIVLSIICTNTLWSQTTHTITLNVNTAEISDSNLSSTCNFGQAAGISNEDFNIDVRMGDEVRWEIRATDSDPSEVALINIKYVRGRNLFKKDKINDSGGIIKANVVAGVAGQSEKYAIKFKVKGKGTFVIDPKITLKI
jgi:hypothetical protein